jgi:hypothetical protein
LPLACAVFMKLIRWFERRSNRVLLIGNLPLTFTNDSMVIDGYLWPTGKYQIVERHKR